MMGKEATMETAIKAHNELDGLFDELAVAL
jgi:hypothetical protein